MSKSPLNNAQKEADSIKKSVEKLVKESNKTIKNTKLQDKDVKQKQLYLECRRLKAEVTKHLAKTEALTANDEPKKVKNYDNKKGFEVNRLGIFQNQLSQVMPKLCPDEKEEEFIQQLIKNGEISDGEASNEVQGGVEKEEENIEEKEEEDQQPDEHEKVAKDDKKKDKKDKKKKDKKNKDKDDDKESNSEDKKDKKDKDKKDEEKSKKDKDKKDKDKDKTDKGKDKKDKDKKGKDDKDNVSIEEIKDEVKTQISEDEDSEDEDIEEEIDEEIAEDIEGDDEEEEESEEEEVVVKKEAVKPVQAKPRKSLIKAPETVQDIKAVESEEEDEESEEEDGTDDEDEVDNKVEQKLTNQQIQQALPTAKKEDDDEEDDDDEEEESEEEEDEDEEEEGEDEEDEEEEEEDEEEEEGDEEGNTDLEVTQPTSRFEVIEDFDAEADGDLTVKKGEIIRIVETREDGWWKAENEKGDEGLVPKTYLQMFNPYKDVQQEDEVKEKVQEEDDDEEGVLQEGEEDTEGKTPTSKRSGKELWGSLRKTVNETLVSDVLHAMGAGPSGFRMPTLSKYFNDSDKFRMKNFLAPKLSISNLSYRDLFFNPATGQMRATTVRLEKVITIAGCQQIPPPAAGIIVQRRYVRMCLFDGINVLSNIHTVRVAAEDKTERNWSFNNKVTDVMDVQLHNEFFIRTNGAEKNVGVLFELCISCVKQVQEKTEERGEFSCGWVLLPLIDDTGVPIANKNYDLYVHGGTPYERDVEVDPSISRRASSNALVSLISGNKQPRLTVRVGLPSKDQKLQLDLLPETLVGDTCLLNQYSFYRQILADSLIINRLDLDSTEPIHSPFLNLFPQVGDQPDLMSLFRESWVTKLKTVKRAEKPSFFFNLSKLRDSEAMKRMFQDVFLESVYPVISSSNLVAYRTGNTEIEMKRKNAIQKIVQVKRERKSALAALLASDIVYTPFEMSEVTFNVIGPHSLSENIVPIPVEA